MKQSAGTQIPPRLRIEVRARDRYCVCDRAGFPDDVQAFCRANYTEAELDHVRGSGALGQKSRTDIENLVLLSGWCHRWKTEHGKQARPLLLDYLERVGEHSHVDPVPGCITCYEVFG